MPNSLSLPRRVEQDLCPQEAAQELLRRRQARSNLLDFTIYTFRNYQVWWHHKLLAEMLDEVLAGKIKRLMINFPPQIGKSELITRRFPAYVLGRDPDRKRAIIRKYIAAMKAMPEERTVVVSVRSLSSLCGHSLVAPKGFEPSISWLRTMRPGPLDEQAVNTILQN